MSYFERHVFFCINQRDGGAECCSELGAANAQAHAKARLQAANAHGPGKVRANRAGCLDRCSEGPVLVVYPEGVWYRYVDTSDIDEIVDRHLIGGETVERLRI